LPPPIGSAQLANCNSDGSAFNAYVNNAANNDKFIIDSGASHHMVNPAALLVNLHKLSPVKQIRIGDGTHLAATAMGTLQIGDVNFANALLVPQLASTLVSVGATPPGYRWDFAQHQTTLYRQQTALLVAQKINDLYIIKASRYHALIASSADPIAVLKDWHRRLGHLNKGTRIATALSAPPDTRASHLLDLIHVDLWGPATATSMGGKQYFLSCYDDFSHHINLYFLATKFDALAALKEYATMAETQTGRKIKQIRSDGGGEFVSHAALSFYKHKGIEHLLVPFGSHPQNGRVERVHLTILNLVRTYLTDCALSPTYWAEAASYVAYIRNRTPCKPSNNISDDIWYNKKKSHSHLQPWLQALLPPT
jgi:transposase InsO family protein